MSPEIIVATSRVCKPEYDPEFLPDILSEEGNHIFLLVQKKYVIGFIIANNTYYEKKCTNLLNNTSYIKLLCLSKYHSLYDSLLIPFDLPLLILYFF